MGCQKFTLFVACAETGVLVNSCGGHGPWSDGSSSVSYSIWWQVPSLNSRGGGGCAKGHAVSAGLPGFKSARLRVRGRPFQPEGDLPHAHDPDSFMDFCASQAPPCSPSLWRSSWTVGATEVSRTWPSAVPSRLCEE